MDRASRAVALIGPSGIETGGGWLRKVGRGHALIGPSGIETNDAQALSKLRKKL